MMVDERCRRLLIAREAVFTSRNSATHDRIRPQILDSWRRSLLYGLDPEKCSPLPTAGDDTANQLQRAAVPIIASRQAALSQSSCSLSLTDAAGRILNRWVEDNEFAALLDRHSVIPDYSVAETTTGTTSGGIVLETGRAATVIGPEHFNDTWLNMTCAGAPIRHPITRRLIGSLNLSVRYSDTSPFLQSWVTDLCNEIERSLLDDASRRERALLTAYLAENRDARHAVLCVDDHTVISNATAARLVNSVDQSLVWEQASHHIHGGGPALTTVTLSDGAVASIDITAVHEGPRAFGALVRLSLQDAPRPIRRTGHGNRPAQSPSIDGLVGRSEAWVDTCRQMHATATDNVLVIGEPGVGKFAALTAVASTRAIVVDPASEGLDPQNFRDALRSACSSDATEVLIRHIDHLDDRLAASIIGILTTATDRGTRVTATMTTDGRHHNALTDWFDRTVRVPALSERLEDIPLLLDALSARKLSGVRAVRWLPEAVQTMRRLHWSRNVNSLDAAVRGVLGNTTHPTIGAEDLPPALRARASRRDLVGLEHVEAKAIMEALHAAHGNKRLAADSLGIARSTLYRKVRALGIDLSTTTF